MLRWWYREARKFNLAASEFMRVKLPPYENYLKLTFLALTFRRSKWQGANVKNFSFLILFTVVIWPLSIRLALVDIFILKHDGWAKHTFYGKHMQTIWVICYSFVSKISIIRKEKELFTWVILPHVVSTQASSLRND